MEETASLRPTETNEVSDSVVAIPQVTHEDLLDQSDDNKVDSGDTPVEGAQNYQGPHDWRKSLRPVKSPIKSDSTNPFRFVTCSILSKANHCYSLYSVSLTFSAGFCLVRAYCSQSSVRSFSLAMKGQTFSVL